MPENESSEIVERENIKVERNHPFLKNVLAGILGSAIFFGIVSLYELLTNSFKNLYIMISNNYYEKLSTSNSSKIIILNLGFIVAAFSIVYMNHTYLRNHKTFITEKKSKLRSKNNFNFSSLTVTILIFLVVFLGLYTAFTEALIITEQNEFKTELTKLAPFVDKSVIDTLNYQWVTMECEDDYNAINEKIEFYKSKIDTSK